ncbi:MAG: CBS domain-containing protein [Proteobacteria bacterium]|nr:CBS domain-containing protein [Pseudomonadota bacterium]MBU1058569.1 CBS domain-containing protein [Pseudomonadota bacterium]
MFVKLWMQQDFISVDQDASLAEAQAILAEHNFRHLLVVEIEKLMGIISQTDIQKALPSAMDSSLKPHERILAAQAKVSSFMTTTPITADPMDPLEDIAILMRKFKIGAVPVLKDQKIVGIITESDIFRAFVEILGGGEEGARVEIEIGKDSSAIYTVIDICKQFDIELIAITVLRNFSPDRQLLTLRLKGKKLEQMVDGLWKAGTKVNRILMDHNDE